MYEAGQSCYTKSDAPDCSIAWLFLASCGENSEGKAERIARHVTQSYEGETEQTSAHKYGVLPVSGFPVDILQVV